MEANFRLTISFRGSEHQFSVTAKASIKELAKQIENVFGIETGNQKLLVHGRNILADISLDLPLSHFGIVDGEKILLVGSTAKEIEAVQDAKSDPLILGFQEELERERRRHKKSKVSSGETNPFISNFEVLEDLQTPPSHLAMSLLKRVANDPGIIGIMKNHNWRVGTLKELRPEGIVGVSEVCVLGLNQNKGESISLRIRTDDFEGFRNYEVIKEVMLHELVHNDFSEHDDRFWHLFYQLKKEVVTSDWTKSKGKTTGRKEVYQMEDEDEPVDQGQILGGVSHEGLSRREILEQTSLQRIAERDGESRRESSPEKEEMEIEAFTHEAPLPSDVIQRQVTEQEEAIKGGARLEPREAPPPILATPAPPILAPATWACKTCTYENEVKSRLCDVCGTPRGMDVRDVAKETPRPEELQAAIAGDDQLHTIQDSTSSVERKIESSLENLLRSATREEALLAMQTLDTIFKNILEHPTEEKYRKISLASRTFQEKIAKHRAGLEVVESVGFAKNVSDNAMFLKRNDLGLLWLARSTVQSKIKSLVAS